MAEALLRSAQAGDHHAPNAQTIAYRLGNGLEPPWTWEWGGEVLSNTLRHHSSVREPPVFGSNRSGDSTTLIFSNCCRRGIISRGSCRAR
jgi:hypothetical protein